MVDNGVGDDVEPKPAKKEASDDASGEGSGDVKPTVNVKPFLVKIPFQACIGKIQEPKPVPIGVVCEGRDFASYFTTTARWREQQELLDWVRRQGVRAGFGVCIDKSVIKRPYLTMQCERSGIYKPPKMKKKPNLEGIGSRKCNCPFRLKGFFDKDTNDWWLAMLCGMHNHDLDEKLDELKAKLDVFFIQIGSNNRICDVIVNVSGLDFGEDKEEDFWKTVYYPQLLKDDSGVDYMFRLMVENNTLYLFVRSVEV